MLCPNCNIRKAKVHAIFGFVNCSRCNNNLDIAIPSKSVEFTTDSIREQREAHFDDIHPFHYKGQASKEWIERFGADKAKLHGLTDKEIKNAKYVHNYDRYYKKH